MRWLGQNQYRNCRPGLERIHLAGRPMSDHNILTRQIELITAGANPNQCKSRC